ncbi:MAG: CxxC-x17-CxxC domain-containing protein [Patescibacteria group bacterium]
MGNFGYGKKRSGGDSDRGFSRDQAPRGEKKFGRGRPFVDRSEGDFRPANFEATCSDCGGKCRLPFKPSGNRPVFCSKCFDKQGGGAAMKKTRFAPSRSENADNGELLEMLKKLNYKVDSLIEMLATKKPFEKKK